MKMHLILKKEPPRTPRTPRKRGIFIKCKFRENWYKKFKNYFYQHIHPLL